MMVLWFILVAHYSELITMKVEKFEDLIAWKKARELTKEIYQFTGDGDFSRDFGLRDQIRRASVSIMSNPVK